MTYETSIKAVPPSDRHHRLDEAVEDPGEGVEGTGQHGKQGDGSEHLKRWKLEDCWRGTNFFLFLKHEV